MFCYLLCNIIYGIYIYIIYVAHLKIKFQVTQKSSTFFWSSSRLAIKLSLKVSNSPSIATRSTSGLSGLLLGTQFCREEDAVWKGDDLKTFDLMVWKKQKSLKLIDWFFLIH